MVFIVRVIFNCHRTPPIWHHCRVIIQCDWCLCGRHFRFAHHCVVSTCQHVACGSGVELKFHISLHRSVYHLYGGHHLPVLFRQVDTIGRFIGRIVPLVLRTLDQVGLYRLTRTTFREMVHLLTLETFLPVCFALPRRVILATFTTMFVFVFPGFCVLARCWLYRVYSLGWCLDSS